MPKITYISPKVFVEKVRDFIRFRVMGSDQEISPDEEPTTSQLSEAARLNVSLRDVKIMSTSLTHFHKYLKAKGQAKRSEEVAALEQKLREFIVEQDEPT